MQEGGCALGQVPCEAQLPSQVLMPHAGHRRADVPIQCGFPCPPCWSCPSTPEAGVEKGLGLKFAWRGGLMCEGFMQRCSK